MDKNNHRVLWIAVIFGIVLIVLFLYFTLTRSNQPITPQIPSASPSAILGPTGATRPTGEVTEELTEPTIPTDLPDPTSMGGGN